MKCRTNGCKNQADINTDGYCRPCYEAGTAETTAAKGGMI